MPLYRFEILLRIKRRRSFDEHIERIGGDDVEFLCGGEQIVARVVKHDMRARIERHVVILRAEKAR